VYPTAGFVETARFHGAQAVELNLDTSEISENFDEGVRGSASIEVAKFVERLLNEA